MRAKCKSRATVFQAAISAVVTMVVVASTSSAQAALTLGHQQLLERGLQIEALCMPATITDAGGTLDLDLYKDAHFTTMNLWNLGYTYDQYVTKCGLPSGSSALPFSRLVTSSTAAFCSSAYIPNIVRIQYGDEQDLNSSYYSAWAGTLSALKARIPTAMVYMNNDEAYSDFSTSTLGTFVQQVKPDMLSFTSYPFRWQGASHNYYGGSPTFFFAQVEQYRKVGLAGLTGDGSQPIPVSMFVQTFAQLTNTSTNHRQPTESEFRMQQFVGWASGMKMVSAFTYGNIPSSDIDSMLFTGTLSSSQTPTTQYYQYAELNRQSLNLGPALVRLISKGFFIKMGQYKSGSTTYTDPTPTGVTTWSYSSGSATDPYLTSMTVTNSGTCNSSLPGNAILGYFKPLDSSLVAAGSGNDTYFMIVNGLTDGTATTAAACTQNIHLTFNWNLTDINGLQRLNRDTGLVEDVALTYLGSAGCYGLDLTLEGGTGDLFKYNTGSAFVPEPASCVLLLAGILSWFVWRKRRTKGHVHN